VPGADLPGVLTLRSREDAERLVALAGDASRAVIVGASFIGMEAAASLRTRGLDVTVTAPGAVPLAGALGELAGATVRAVHEQHGVEFALGRSVVGIRADGGRLLVDLDDGSALAGDLVLAGIGVSPATGFVQGLELDGDGGIPVDERLRAADGVWAAGDVARYREPHTGRDVRIEHWRLAQQHGRAAARSMTGGGEPFTGVPFFWTQHFDLQLGYAGAGRGWDRQVVLGAPEIRDFLVVYGAGAQALAACGTRDRELGAFMELMRLGRLPDLDQLEAAGDPSLAEVLRAGEI
jgi:apoptosis-inducing factor 3